MSRQSVPREQAIVASLPNQQRQPVPGRLVAAWRFFSDPKSSWLVKLLFLLAVAYLVFPFDLVPDVLPVVGWLDDLGFLTLASALVLRALRPYREPPVITVGGESAR